MSSSNTDRSSLERSNAKNGNNNPSKNTEHSSHILDAESPISSQARSTGAEECSICCEVITASQYSTIQPCMHTFDKTCIQKWLAAQWLARGFHTRNLMCPDCRGEVEHVRHDYNESRSTYSILEIEDSMDEWATAAIESSLANGELGVGLEADTPEPITMDSVVELEERLERGLDALLGGTSTSRGPSHARNRERRDNAVNEPRAWEVDRSATGPRDKIRDFPGAMSERERRLRALATNGPPGVEDREPNEPLDERTRQYLIIILLSVERALERRRQRQPWIRRVFSNMWSSESSRYIWL